MIATTTTTPHLTCTARLLTSPTAHTNSLPMSQSVCCCMNYQCSFRSRRLGPSYSLSSWGVVVITNIHMLLAQGLDNMVRAHLHNFFEGSGAMKSAGRVKRLGANAVAQRNKTSANSANSANTSYVSSLYSNGDQPRVPTSTSGSGSYVVDTRRAAQRQRALASDSRASRVTSVTQTLPPQVEAVENESFGFDNDEYLDADGF